MNQNVDNQIGGFAEVEKENREAILTQEEIKMLLTVDDGARLRIWDVFNNLSKRHL